MSAFRNIYTIKLLRIALGFFFIVLGVLGVLPDVEEGLFSLNNHILIIEVLFGIVEIICGLLLILGFLAFSNSKAISMGGIIVLLFWIARIVLTKFIWCLRATGNSISFVFYPNFAQWLLVLSCELVILVAIMIVIKRYD